MRRRLIRCLLTVTFSWEFVFACATGLDSSTATENLQVVHFGHLNEVETYYTIHNVKKAHGIAQGDGVKVGILDSDFGYDDHPELYAGSMDFINQSSRLHKIGRHGYWMASTLREIAPKCEIYALNVFALVQETRIRAIASAVDWAAANGIDVLTYSGAAISPEYLPLLDAALDSPPAKNLIITFINYNNVRNIKPDGFFPYRAEGALSRAPDINILHYDYNTLTIATYERYVKSRLLPRSGSDVPYLSISSTSVVAGGFAAILKSIKPTLTPTECKDLLVSTSRLLEFYDPFFQQILKPAHVVDIGRAAQILLSQHREK